MSTQIATAKVKGTAKFYTAKEETDTRLLELVLCPRRRQPGQV